jgi:hypothetical protein
VTKAAAKPEDILRGHPAETVALAERLRRLVKETVPDAEERAYPGWRGIGYRTREAGYFCGIFPRGSEVRLLFERGVDLPDPDGVLTEGGTQTRYAVLVPGKPVPERSLARLLVLASGGG